MIVKTPTQKIQDVASYVLFRNGQPVVVGKETQVPEGLVYQEAEANDKAFGDILSSLSLPEIPLEYLTQQMLLYVDTYLGSPQQPVWSTALTFAVYNRIGELLFQH